MTPEAFSSKWATQSPIALAVIFYRIGDHEYHHKGWLLALLSLGASFGGAATGFSFIGVVAANVLLYLGLLVYNLLSKKPPGSQSGF